MTKRILCLMLALILILNLSGCGLITYGIRHFFELDNEPVPEEWNTSAQSNPEYEIVQPPEPTKFYDFSGKIFLEFNGEKTTEYDGNGYNMFYNYDDEDMSNEEIASTHFEMYYQTDPEGAFMDFLRDYCIGTDALVETRTIIKDGVKQPYSMLYIRLYYPDYEEYPSQQTMQNDVDIKYDQQLILLNCDEPFIEMGIYNIFFSAHTSEDAISYTVIFQENGTFIE